MGEESSFNSRLTAFSNVQSVIEILCRRNREKTRLSKRYSVRKVRGNRLQRDGLPLL